MTIIMVIMMSITITIIMIVLIVIATMLTITRMQPKAALTPRHNLFSQPFITAARVMAVMTTIITKDRDYDYDYFLNYLSTTLSSLLRSVFAILWFQSEIMYSH